MLALFLLPLPASAATLDVSALVPWASPVARTAEGLCTPPRSPDAVLGTAVVVYGRLGGRSAWGHISLRFLSCEGGQLRDVEYEVTRFDRTAVEWLQDIHQQEDWPWNPALLRRNHDRLLLFQNDAPVDSGNWHAELRKNRELTEVWMPWPADVQAEILQGLDAAYADQMERLRHETPLDTPHYRAMAHNCTALVRQALAAAGDPWSALDTVYPLTFLRRVAQRSDVDLVVHPSMHVLAEIQHQHGDLEGARSGAEVPVFRPLVRRRIDLDSLDTLQARIADDAWSVGVARVATPSAVPHSGQP